MNIDLIAQQLRQIATVFNGNVAGAAAYANGVQNQVWLPLPAAYVIPLGQDAEESTSATGLQQIVRERFGVIVVVDTLMAGGSLDLADRRGQAAVQSLDGLRASIFSAVLNWRPDFDPNNLAAMRDLRGIYYVGADFPEAGAFDFARLFYQFTFGCDAIFTDMDGWQQPYDQLKEIDTSLTDINTGTTVVQARVTFPYTPSSS